MKSQEVKIDVIQPNMLHANDAIYTSLFPADEVIPFCKKAAGIIEKNIGPLYTLSYFEKCLEAGKPGLDLESVDYDFPLTKYLETFESKNKEHKGVIALTVPGSISFNLGMFVDAQNYKLIDEARDILQIQEFIQNPNLIQCHKACAIDKKKTVKNIKKEYDKLIKKFPDTYVSLTAMPILPLSVEKTKAAEDTDCIGVIQFANISGSNKEKIETTKDELVEALKGFDGPRLSLDAPILCTQLMDLFYNSYNFILRYGDVIQQNRESRFFIIDP